MEESAQIIRRGYRYRLRSNSKAEALLRRYAGCCRKVWNMSIAEQQRRRAAGEPYANYVAMSKWLTAWKKGPELSFLKQVPAHVLQNVLVDLHEAYQDFFKHKGGYPKFKRYGEPIGLRETDIKCFEVDNINGRVKFPKLGWLRYRNSRAIEGTPKIITIKHDLDGWYMSVMAELQTKQRVPESTAIGAADRGVNVFIATDTGRLVTPLDAHKKSLYRLRRYQRSVTRKMEAAKVVAGIRKDQPFPKGFKLKTSNRLKKAQVKVAKLQQKVARQRHDFLHNLSTQIADGHALFCLEDLKVRNMTASAAGTVDAPGKNVKQKSGLNRSILDQGWSMWAGMVEYKLTWRGGRLLKVPAAYTSQQCSHCGHLHADNRHGEKFRCLACSYEDHADVNAAKNILAAGLAVLAMEESKALFSQAVVEDAVQSDPPVKRLPTEGLRRAA